MVGTWEQLRHVRHGTPAHMSLPATNVSHLLMGPSQSKGVTEVEQTARWVGGQVGKWVRRPIRRDARRCLSIDSHSAHPRPAVPPVTP